MIFTVITIQKNEINSAPSPVFQPTLIPSPTMALTFYPKTDLTSSPTKTLTLQPTNAATNSLTPPTNDPAYNATKKPAIDTFKPTYNPSNSLSIVTCDASAHNFIEVNKNVYDQITNEESVSIILNAIELNSPPISIPALTIAPLITPTIVHSTASTNSEWNLPTAVSTNASDVASDVASQPYRSVIFFMENSTLPYRGTNVNLANSFNCANNAITNQLSIALLATNYATINPTGTAQLTINPANISPSYSTIFLNHSPSFKTLIRTNIATTYTKSPLTSPCINSISLPTNILTIISIWNSTMNTITLHTTNTPILIAMRTINPINTSFN